MASFQRGLDGGRGQPFNPHQKWFVYEPSEKDAPGALCALRACVLVYPSGGTRRNPLIPLHRRPATQNSGRAKVVPPAKAIKPYWPEELELLGGVLLELLPELLPEELPGDSAPPVAEPAPDRPKYEKTLWRQLGCDRSVLASKLGADSNLELSPENTNDTDWLPLVELLLVEPVVEALMLEGRRSIQGTAICLPELLVVELVELPDKVELELPALPRLLEALPELVPDGLVPAPELLEGLVLLGLVLLPEVLPEGLVALPVLPAAPDKLRTAKSILPEAGFTIMSLMVPISLPELPVTCAPVSWLPLISW